MTYRELLAGPPRRNIFVLVGFALCLNLFFLSFNHNRNYFGAIAAQHAEVGYNLYRSNSIKINSERIKNVIARQEKENRLIDYSDLEDREAKPNRYRRIHDTLGYGVLLGLLWKLTGSLKYYDVQLLQVFLYAVLMLLVYGIALMLFNDKRTAFLVGLVHLFFLPLVFLNVQAIRDIWAYYGLVVLIFSALQYYHGGSMRALCSAHLFFNVCVWMRPTIFFSLIAVTVVMAWYIWSLGTRKMFLFLFTSLASNAVFFWLPFTLYNYQAYGQLIVSCAGHDLLQGLGELPDNPWKFPFEDRHIEAFIRNRHGFQMSDCQVDDYKKQFFLTAVKENPLFYVKTVLRRIPSLIFFRNVWSYDSVFLFQKCSRWRDVIMTLIQHPLAFIMKILEWILVRLHLSLLFVLLGWMGLVLSLFDKKYLLSLLGLAIIVSSYSKLPSHIEARYLVSSYWIFSWFVAYLMQRVYFRLRVFVDKLFNLAAGRLP